LQAILRIGGSDPHHGAVKSDRFGSQRTRRMLCIMEQKNMSDFNRIDYSIHSVAELVAASLAGDRDAFGELFQRHERQVFAIAYRRLSDRDEADEMVQEVFIQAWRKLSQLS
jgi:hypothetical protein